MSAAPRKDEQVGTTPAGGSLAMRLVGVGVPEALALVLAEACTTPPEQRTGEAALCVLELPDALEVAGWLEQNLTGGDLGDTVFKLLGAAGALFGAEVGSRIVLDHMPAAVEALEAMADSEPEADSAPDSLFAAMARAEPLMLKAALELAASSDPRYDRGLYMDESVLLPAFVVAGPEDAEPAEYSGALVSTPYGIVFVLSNAVLSESTARLVPEDGLLGEGALHVGLEKITAAAFFVPEALGEFEGVAGVQLGLSPDGDVHVHLELEGLGPFGVRLLFAGWPPGRQDALRRRLAVIMERIGDALAAR